MKKFTLSSAVLMILTVAIVAFQISCKKIDEALDYGLNFDGVFASTNGNEVLLKTEGNNHIGSGKYTKIGTSSVGHMDVGEVFCDYMERINENTWKGKVRERSGNAFNFMTYGEISLNDNGNLLTISPNGLPIYTYTRVSRLGSGGTGTNTEILVNQCISGSVGDKKIINFVVPTNVTKMEIRTFEEAGSCDRNAADLFVRKGSNPTITSTTPYVWAADCASIKPNREDEVCVFNNPSSGTWSVMLFGYNTFFISKLKITITK